MVTLLGFGDKGMVISMWRCPTFCLQTISWFILFAENTLVVKILKIIQFTYVGCLCDLKQFW